MQLFSRIDIGVSRPADAPRRTFHSTNERTHEVIATPNDQPTFIVV